MTTLLEIHLEMGNLAGIFGSLVPIVAIVGGISFALASRYLKSKERMEMISRGMDISAIKDYDVANEMARSNRRGKRNPLRAGMVWLAVGMGLLLSYYLCHYVLKGSEDESTAIYFGVISIFVGLALVLSHVMYKPEAEKDPKGAN